MKLFIDDIRAPWTGWHRARTISEAIRILATMPVEIISLDHDIANGCSCGREWSSGETFEPIARYIALMNPRPVVQFHTANITGGQRMADIIGIKYGYTPYQESKDL